LDLAAGTVTVERSRVALRGGDTTEDDAKSEAACRTVPVERMLPGTVALLRALSARQAVDRMAAGAAWEPSGLVLTDALGRGVHPDAYSAAFRRLTVEAGLPSVKLHALRHSLATVLHGAGVPPANAASLLGHRLATHLAFYVKSTESGGSEAADVFGDVMAAAVR
jgi:integrase